MADHIRSELVVDALQMAIWNRRPAPGAIHHSDHGSTYTSWAFGHRLREAGLLGSMGSIGQCFDNSVAESFFATLQTELLDRSSWPTREGLAQAVFGFIEGFYNPRRRHSTLGYLSPADYEREHLSGRHRDRRMMPVHTPAPSGVSTERRGHSKVGLPPATRGAFRGHQWGLSHGHGRVCRGHLPASGGTWRRDQRRTATASVLCAASTPRRQAPASAGSGYRRRTVSG
jgi:hypothetical protein